MYEPTPLWPIMLDALGGVFVFTIFAYPSIFVHELGHVIAAKIVGLNPTHLVVGESEDLFRRRYWSVEIIVRLVPFAGIAVLREEPTTRFQEAAFAMSGVIGNLVFAASAVFLWPYCSLHFTLGALILLQLWIVATNLIPGDMEFEGHRLPNDGKRLIAALRKRKANQLLRATEQAKSSGGGESGGER